MCKFFFFHDIPNGTWFWPIFDCRNLRFFQKIFFLIYKFIENWSLLRNPAVGSNFEFLAIPAFCCSLNKIFHYFSSFWFPWGWARILAQPLVTVEKDHPPFLSPTTHIEGLVCICSFQQTIVRRFMWPTTVAFDQKRQRNAAHLLVFVTEILCYRFRSKAEERWFRMDQNWTAMLCHACCGETLRF